MRMYFRTVQVRRTPAVPPAANTGISGAARRAGRQTPTRVRDDSAEGTPGRADAAATTNVFPAVASLSRARIRHDSKRATYVVTLARVQPWPDQYVRVHAGDSNGTAGNERRMSGMGAGSGTGVESARALNSGERGVPAGAARATYAGRPVDSASTVLAGAGGDGLTVIVRSM